MKEGPIPFEDILFEDIDNDVKEWVGMWIVENNMDLPTMMYASCLVRLIDEWEKRKIE